MATEKAPEQFVASDGTVFAKKRLWRQYEFDLKYSFKKKIGEKDLEKLAGSCDGAPFEIADCEDCEGTLTDRTDQIQVDEVKRCKFFIGASSESCFVRNCTDCVFYIACKQLRTRDCVNCTFYLYCQTEPIIETSTGIKFAPFLGGYPEQAEHMKLANLDPAVNLWWGVFDFNDAEKSGKNWSYIPPAERAAPWFPRGDCEQCVVLSEPANFASLPSQNGGNFGGIPTEKGGVAPSTPAPAASGGMLSFSLETTQEEAEAAHLANMLTPPPPAPPSLATLTVTDTPTPAVAAPPPPPPS